MHFRIVAVGMISGMCSAPLQPLEDVALPLRGEAKADEMPFTKDAVSATIQNVG